MIRKILYRWRKISGVIVYCVFCGKDGNVKPQTVIISVQKWLQTLEAAVLCSKISINVVIYSEFSVNVV